LRLLQAQIEPHFLFNTLSNALVLVRTDAEAAARVLEQLTRLLRASLHRTRSAHSTLGEELEVIEAYLSIASVRMGERLDWNIEVSDDLRALELPPLLLQPLVENAVNHGIDPLPAGGTVRVVAEVGAGTMTLSVRDTGVGLIGQASGAGLALDNIRQRLRALYGAAATLDLIELPGGGTEARVRLPMSQHPSRAQA
ncbi:MAG: sensor histidine kinase, partial [Gammaproteobacteria bacterium]